MSSKPQPPDGGWGWVIVICGFVNHMFTVGLMMSLSVFYVSWLDQFGKTKGTTSWILSIGVACLFGGSPVPASLAVRLGFRVVAFLGGLLTSLGLILSVFASSVNYLVVSMGLICGTGCCFCYLSALATVTMYFDKRRALAMGLNTAGVGIGAFALAPFLDHLEQIYGWRGALLVLSAITLHMCVTAMLMRDPEAEREIVVVAEENLLERDTEKQRKVSGEDFDLATSPLIKSSYDDDKMDHEEKASMGDTEIQSSPRGMEASLVNKRSCVDFGTKEHDFEMGDGVTDSLVHQPRNANGSSLHVTRDELQVKMTQLENTHHSCSDRNLDDHQPYRNRADISNTNHNSNPNPVILAKLPSLLHEKERSETNLNPHSNISTSDNSVVGAACDSETPAGRRKCFLSKLLPMETIHRNRVLLSDKPHVAYCISNFITNLSYIAPVVFMVDRAVYLGISKSAGAILVSANGIGNVAGRIFFGYMADRFRNKHMTMYITALIVCGIGTMMSDLCGDNVILHAAYASFFGFLMGTYTVLAPTVSVDLVGTEQFTTAFGQTLFCMGAATIIGPPLAGWLFDWTKSYLLSYLAIGLFFVISGAMLLPLILCRNKKTPTTPTQEASI